MPVEFEFYFSAKLGLNSTSPKLWPKQLRAECSTRFMESYSSVDISYKSAHTHTHTHTHTRLTALFRDYPGEPVYQKGKTNLDFTEARDSEWQWHQPGRMQVCTSLQTDNHTSTPLLKSAVLKKSRSDWLKTGKLLIHHLSEKLSQCCVSMLCYYAELGEARK